MTVKEESNGALMISFPLGEAGSYDSNNSKGHYNCHNARIMRRWAQHSSTVPVSQYEKHKERPKRMGRGREGRGGGNPIEFCAFRIFRCTQDTAPNLLGPYPFWSDGDLEEGRQDRNWQDKLATRATRSGWLDLRAIKRKPGKG
jgi:hypothetical protein